MIRLQKYLSQAGVCSRRMGETYIQKGLVTVNGKTVTELGTQIDPEKDKVAVAGKPVLSNQAPVYIMLNKPQGYISSCRHRGEKIVLDLVNIDQRLYPVGRLDKDSTGLLLLTNDGRLHHRVSHPSFDHEKEYEIETKDPIPDSALKLLEKGIPLDGVTTRPAKIKRMGERKFQITLQEGKKRQIRRMVEKTGNRVIGLHRIRIATLRLGRLASGKWRHLTQKEKASLLESCL
jgi:pseudouridine synthase